MRVSPAFSLLLCLSGLIGSLPLIGADAAKGAAKDEAMVLIEAGDYTKGFKSLKAQAREDDASAQFTLAVMYQMGAGVEIDPAEALVHVRRAAAAGSRQAARWLIEAVGARDSDYFDWYRVSMGAEGFDTVPPASLATPQAGGVRFNLERVERWNVQRAEKGDAVALYNLSRRAVAKAAADGTHWEEFRVRLLAAAQAGSGRACRDISECFTAGSAGFAQDAEKAEAFVLRGAEAGDAICQYRMARGFAYGERGHKPDVEQARKWFELAAAQGQVDAINQLGDLLRARSYEGFDGPRGFKLALRAADLGDLFADGDLALGYLQGWCTERDVARAVVYFRKMIDRGDGWAAEQLANLYLTGKDVPRDEAEAEELFEIAAEANRSSAMVELGQIYENRGDFKMAFKWFDRAARLGEAKAQFRVAEFLEDGRGVGIDRAEAEVWLALAAGHNYQPAVQRLDNRRIRVSRGEYTADPEMIVRQAYHGSDAQAQAALLYLFQWSQKSGQALHDYVQVLLDRPHLVAIAEPDLAGRIDRMDRRFNDRTLKRMAVEVMLLGPGGTKVELERGRKELERYAKSGDLPMVVLYLRWLGDPSSPIRNVDKLKTIFKRQLRANRELQDALAARLKLVPEQPAPPSPDDLVKLQHDQIDRALTEPARPLYRCAPEYPMWERLIGEKAAVEVSYEIDTAGLPQNLNVIGTVPQPFAEKAMNAVKRWRFAPALLDGRPVASRRKTTIEFSFTEY